MPALAFVVATGQEPLWSDSRATLRRFEPALSRVRFESPLLIVVEIPNPILSTVASMAFVIYGVKRIWGISLEFKTHRENQRAKFEEAATRAEEARVRLEQVRHQRLSSVRARHLLDEEQLAHLEPEARRRLEEETLSSLLRDPPGLRESVIREVSAEQRWNTGAVSRLEQNRTSGWRGRATLFDEDE